MSEDRQPIACSLDAAGLRRQLSGWENLSASCRAVTVDDDGCHARLWFEADRGSELRRLAAAEQECCGFLTLSVTSEEALVRLDIGSDNPDARAIVATLVDAAGTPEPTRGAERPVDSR
ncbi:MAG TPA: hypothetical protein VFA11_01070 [Acidimicrobiales bacterium]|nr:hypothetical protein [Acidimicrobiales bacterium]